MFNITLLKSEFEKDISEDEFNIDYLMQLTYTLNSRVIIRWNDYPINICMKYDIASMIGDIYQMVDNLLLWKKNEFNVSWPSSAFMAIWECTLVDETLTIKAYWTSIPGPTEELEKLRQRPDTIQVNLKHFLSEWYKLLLKIKEDNPQGKLKDAEDYWKFEEVLEELDSFLIN